MTPFPMLSRREVLAVAGASLLHGQPAPTEDPRLRPADTNTHFAWAPPASLNEWTTRREALRRQVLTAAGLNPLPPRGPLTPQRVRTVERSQFSVETLMVPTLPGYFVGANLYLPKGKGPFPGVLVAHGHWKGGRAEDSDAYSGPALGANLAAQGYAALAWDMVGWNDTAQTPHAFGDSRAEQFWLYGPLGLQLWNSLRMLDYLAARPDVDAQRIGMTGASGGATQTFTLMAVDDRIAVAAPVNMVSFIMQGGSPCENAPGLRVGTQNVEIAALMAPKPMLAVAATGDWTRNVPREEFPALQKVYELYSQADEIDAQQFDFPHNYNRTSREAVYRFLRKHLLERPDEGPVTESVAHGLTREELLARPQWTPPADSLDAAGVYRWWREQALATWRAQSRADRRRRLRDVLQAEWPEGPAAAPAEGRVTIVGPRNTPVPGTWLPGKGNGLVLAVHPDGAEAARQAHEVQREIQRGAGVLALDVFGRVGQPVPPGEGTKFFHTFHRSLDAERVQDVLTGLAFLASRGKRGATGPEIRLVGLGTQGQIWATLAAAVQPLGTQVRLVTPAPPIADEEALERVVFVPGLLHAGGLAGALKLAMGPATEPPRRGRIPW